MLYLINTAPFDFPFLNTTPSSTGWQDHYELKFSASIGCVNSNISAAEPLLNRMERMFFDTLKIN